MCKSQLDLLEAQYEESLGRLAAVLELEPDEVSFLLSNVLVAGQVAIKLRRLFRSPEIVSALDDVIRISAEYASTTERKAANIL